MTEGFAHRHVIGACRALVQIRGNLIRVGVDGVNEPDNTGAKRVRTDRTAAAPEENLP
jgi:hypothetical protein